MSCKSKHTPNVHTKIRRKYSHNSHNQNSCCSWVNTPHSIRMSVAYARRWQAAVMVVLGREVVEDVAPAWGAQ